MANLPSTLPNDLPRRLTALFLMFGLLAVVWLAVAMVMVMNIVHADRSDNAMLTRLGRAVTQTANELRQPEPAARLQKLMIRLQAEGNLSYAALVGPNGNYLAHSSAELVGKPAVEPTGVVDQWGGVARHRYLGEDGQPRLEYRSAVTLDGRTVGSLRVASVERDISQTLLDIADRAPWAIAGPISLLGVGAWMVQRQLRGIAAFDRQLAELGRADDPASYPLEPIASYSPSAIGWNILVDERQRARTGSSLHQRLAMGLDGFRQKKAEQILHTLPDGVALTDADHIVTFANHAFGVLLEAPETRMVGRPVDECLALASASDEARPLMNHELSERTVVAELGRSGDMAQGILRVARYPLRGDDGFTVVGHVWSVRDITQQKLADQMRNQFVYSATHELRTPLANIRAYAETLADAEVVDLEQQKMFSNTINSEATRLSRFIDDLLSISRMQAGAMTLDRQPVDMERLVQSVAVKMRGQMAQKRITFECDIPPKVPEIIADKEKITVALINLLGNAAKYTPAGGVVALQVEAGKEQIVIHVSDTGIGISMEELPKIFDKFFRSADPRVQDETGSGLGLSLAYEIVRLHGGKLTVHSELDKGTKFTLVLPTK